jgi:hypothetical protein
MGFLGKKSVRKLNRMVKTEAHHIKRMGHKALHAGEITGTLMRKGGEMMEEVGKAGVVIGGVTGQPELAALGVQAIGAGDLAQVGGMAMRKGALGLRKGDTAKLEQSGGKMLQVFA